MIRPDEKKGESKRISQPTNEFEWDKFDLDNFFKETNEISEIIRKKEKERKENNE